MPSRRPLLPRPPRSRRATAGSGPSPVWPRVSASRRCCRHFGLGGGAFRRRDGQHHHDRADRTALPVVCCSASSCAGATPPMRIRRRTLLEPGASTGSAVHPVGSHPLNQEPSYLGAGVGWLYPPQSARARPTSRRNRSCQPVSTAKRSCATRRCTSYILQDAWDRGNVKRRPRIHDAPDVRRSKARHRRAQRPSRSHRRRATQRRLSASSAALPLIWRACVSTG